MLKDQISKQRKDTQRPYFVSNNYDKRLINVPGQESLYVNLLSSGQKKSVNEERKFHPQSVSKADSETVFAQEVMLGEWSGDKV